MASKYTDFIVLKDRREQNGWIFCEEEKKAGKFRISACVEKHLPTADYTIEGYEDEFLIEKKSGFSELAGNLATKAARERFFREMERMRDIKHKYILVEGNIDADKLKLGIYKSKYGPPMSAILTFLTQISIEYGVHVMFVGDCGEKVARKLMEAFLKSKIA